MISGVVAIVLLIGAGGAYWITRTKHVGAAARPPAAVAPIASRSAVPTSPPPSAASPSAAPSSAAPALSASVSPSSPAAPPPAPGSPAALLASAIAAARAAGSVHMNTTSTDAGHTEVHSDDVGATSGIQRITVDGAKTTVIVIDPVAYFIADRAALLNYYGFDAATASQDAEKWLSLSPGDPGYGDVSDAVTLGSSLDEMELAAPLTKLPAQIRHGIRVIGIKGTPASTQAPAGSTATMWIAASGTPYPVEWDGTVPGAQNSSVATMSGWGEPVHVVAPAGAIPLATGANT